MLSKAFRPHQAALMNRAMVSSVMHCKLLVAAPNKFFREDNSLMALIQAF